MKQKILIIICMILILQLCNEADLIQRGEYFFNLYGNVIGANYDTADYSIGHFDCSNMGAQLHDHLEAQGYDVKVIRGKNHRTDESQGAHIWLLVGDVKNIIITDERTIIKLEEDSYFIEPTNKNIMFSLSDYYNYEDINIYDNYTQIQKVSRDQFEYKRR